MTKGRTRLILLEGIPGSGKTTTAEWVCKWLRDREVDADWSSEMTVEHPVIDRSVMKTSRIPGYGGRCVDRWRAFASKAAANVSPAVHVLEGCLFQSTVRFLLEHDYPEDAPERYFVATEEVLSRLQPRIIYLYQADPRAFMERQRIERKGHDTISKTAAYTETTKIAKRHGWKGAAGMIRFYLHYRNICDQLIDQSRFDVIRLDTSNNDWEALHVALDNWLSR